MKSSLVLIVLFAFGLITGCTSLKEGECKRDSNCDDMAKAAAKAAGQESREVEVWACYKEPSTAEIGKCMRAKEARAALERYQRKLNGKCEDKDGDGVKAGDACDPPIDCNDQDPAVKPGATEVCDMKDNNCNGQINEGLKRCVGSVLGGKQDPVVQFMVTLPAGVAVSPAGEVWLSDQHQIYRIDGEGKAERVAGSNKPGAENKRGLFARFDEPTGLAFDAASNLYVAECANNCVRKLSPSLDASVAAGKCSREEEDTGLDADGSADQARFWCPLALAVEPDGGLLVVDHYNSKIKRIKDQRVETVAGAGGKEENGVVEFGHKNGPAKAAMFNEPSGIALGPDGVVYIADSKNHCIRVLKGGQVSDFAGKCEKGSDKGGYKDGPAAQALFKLPQGLAMDARGLFVVDTGNHCVRLVKNGVVSSVLGKCEQLGYYDGPVDEALFNEPWYMALAKDGTIFVVDHGNYRLRRALLE